MQLVHKEDYEKLLNEFEVDKSPVLRSKQGKVFLIELVDKKHHSDRDSKEEQTTQSLRHEEEKYA